jgi:hypothetical protein
MSQPSRIVLDVTSFISAEEYLLSQNHGTAPLDPFAQQCYAEVVQSLLFFDQVLVPHPTRLNASPEDYGDEPRILRLLFELGIVIPLTFSDSEKNTLVDTERTLLDMLETDGASLMSKFIDTTEICDHEQRTRGSSKVMSSKILDWSNFQDSKVRNVETSHAARVDTWDGVEADPFGDWAMKSARSMEDQLERLLPSPPAQLHLTAVLARSLRYLAKANLKQLVYQAHPLRRDFCLTFDLVNGGATHNEMLDVIGEIRGIHRGLEGSRGWQVQEPLAPARA